MSVGGASADNVGSCGLQMGWEREVRQLWVGDPGGRRRESEVGSCGGGLCGFLWDWGMWHNGTVSALNPCPSCSMPPRLRVGCPCHPQPQLVSHVYPPPPSAPAQPLAARSRFPPVPARYLPLTPSPHSCVPTAASQ